MVKSPSKKLVIIVLVALTAGAAFSVCTAAPRPGSTKATAIPLKQRDPAKAVEEEMAWMMKLFHYTPILATRDDLAEQIRQLKAGKKPREKRSAWGHASEDYNGRLLSHWWFPSPKGKREIYFDTGTLIRTPGEVARQESARALYVGRILPTLEIQ